MSYAGVDLLHALEAERAWIAERIDPARIWQFTRHQWPGLNLAGLPFQSPQDERPVELDTLFWPTGAARWAYGSFLVDQGKLDSIRTAVYGTAGTTYAAGSLVMSDGYNSITTSLWMLPATPLQSIGLDGLYLLTLVDDRWFWWTNAASITCAGGTTTWATLYANIAAALSSPAAAGITLTVDTVSANYLKPPSSLGTKYEALPLLLDAVAYCCGQRIVRQLDGTVRAWNVTASQTNTATQLAALPTDKSAGGSMSLGTFSLTGLTGLDDPAVLPATVTVTFPNTVSGALQAAPYVVPKTLTGLALTETGALAGQTNLAKFFRASAIALEAGPTNATELGNLAGQIATDWYRYQLAPLHLSLIGYPSWTLDGLASWAEYRHRPGELLSLQLHRPPWNDDVEELLYYGTGGSTSGGGAVTNTGDLTANAVVLGNGVNNVKVVPGIVTDGTSQIQLGEAGVSVGSLQLFNATTGSITLQPTTGALGTVTTTLPAANTLVPIIPQQITVIGPTAPRTWTVPDSAFSVARIDAGQTFVGTQTMGALVATTVNGNTFTTGTGTLTIGAGKTLTASNSLTLAGTDSTVMTFPTTSATIARTDAGQTFTGTQVFGAVTVTTVNGSALGTAAFAATGASGHTLPYLDAANIFQAATSQTINIADVNTNSIQTVLSLSHDLSSGSGANGIGGTLELRAQTTTTADMAAAYLQWTWATATHASRRGELGFFVDDSTTGREFLRGATSGTAAKIGVLGATPIVAQTGDLATAMAAFGFGSGFTVTATGGTATAVTVANEATDTTCFPLFATAATGDLGPKTNAALTFNSSTGLLSATSLGGTLTTAAQPNITSVGTLTSLAVTGTTAEPAVIIVADAATTTVSAAISLEHTTSGTAGVGFGTGISFDAEDAGGTLVAIGDINVSWATATHASRKGRMTLTVQDSAGTREGVRIEGDGSSPMIGFMGAAATAAQVSPDIGSDYVTRGLAGGTPTFACANLTGTIANSQLAFPRNYILLQEQQTSGTAGGGFTSGAWRTRVLNTEVADTGSECSLSSNQITLTAGTYECYISAPAIACASHQTRLQNVTDATTVLTGTSEFNAAASNVQTRSVIMGRFTIAASKALEVQHQCTTTKTVNGLGVAGSLGTEVYTCAEFRRVA